jgi:hypothetical protein
MPVPIEEPVTIPDTEPVPVEEPVKVPVGPESSTV